MTRLEALFGRLMAARAPAALAVAASLAAVALAAPRIQSDFAIEHYFPGDHPRRADFERLDAVLALDDARLVVLAEAPDVFAPEALARIEALSADLAACPHVLRVTDLLNALDVRDAGGLLSLEPLIGALEGEPPDPARVARARRAVREDPLFRGVVADPAGRAAALRIVLTPAAAASAPLREEFLLAAERVLERHRAGLALSMAGTPTARARIVRGMRRDMARLFPAAAALTLALLLGIFRSLFDAAAVLAVCATGIAWTYGLLAVSGAPLTFLTSVTPLVVLTVGASDAIHVITDMRLRVAAGAPGPVAARQALATLAGPCLMTVLAVVGGLLALLALDIRLVTDFALLTSAGMAATWAATLIVLPIAYAARAPRALVREAGASWLVGATDRALTWLGGLPTRRPAAVTAAALAAAVACGLLAREVGRECYLLDDLAEESAIVQDRRRVEELLGGSFSLVVHAWGDDEGILDPAALDLLAACEQVLSEQPEVERTASVLDPLRKAHRLLAPELAAQHPLPRSAALAAQELLFVEDPDRTGGLLDPAHANAAVYGYVRDLGSTATRDLVARVEDGLRRAQRRHPGARVEVALTGFPVVMQGVFDSLVGDLGTSFGLSLLGAFAVFALVFRSARYGLLAVIPNAAPMLATFAFMALLDVDLKPSTVMVFSVAFAIAADDTVHYVARFRRCLAEGEPHLGLAPGDRAAAARHALREAGLAIVLTSLALAGGFLILVLSEFQGLVHLGVLIGVTLLAAAATELLLTPLLLTHLAPRP